jgi:F-type H+-transporting ATPase subunit b
MPQLELHFFPTQIFWLVIIFTCIYLFISRYFVPKISSIIKTRQDIIQQHLQTAERLLEEQKLLQTEINELIEQTKEEALRIKQDAYQAATETLQMHIAKAEDVLTEKMIKEEERLVHYKIELQKNMQDVVNNLSKEILIMLFSKSKISKKLN